MRQTQADSLIYATRADIRDLIAGNVRDIEKLWNGIDELLDSEADRVAGRLCVAVALRRDCTAGCEDRDIRKRSVYWCLDVLSDEQSVDI